MAKSFKKYSKQKMQDLIGDGTYSIKERLRIAIMTQPPKPWPAYDGTTLDRNEYITASEASKCVRQLSFEKHKGMATVAIPDFWETMSDEDFKAHLLNMGNNDKRGIFERGNVMESWIVTMLMAMEQEGEDTLYLGEEQRSFYTNKKKVSGTPDGVYVNHEEKTWRTLEFKTSQNEIIEPRNNHVTQVQMNAGLIDHLNQIGAIDPYVGFAFSEYKLVGVNLAYINTDNWLDIEEFKFQPDNGEAFSQASQKARTLWYKDPVSKTVKMRNPQDLPPEGLESWGGCMFCDNRAACQEIEQSRQNADTVARIQKAAAFVNGERKPPTMPVFSADVSRDKVIGVLLEYDGARAEESAAKKVKEAMKEAVKPWLAEQEDRKAEFTEDGLKFSATLTSSERDGGYDMDQIRAALDARGCSMDLFKKPKATQETFNVKVTKVNKDA